MQELMLLLIAVVPTWGIVLLVKAATTKRVGGPNSHFGKWAAAAILGVFDLYLVLEALSRMTIRQQMFTILALGLVVVLMLKLGTRILRATVEFVWNLLKSGKNWLTGTRLWQLASWPFRWLGGKIKGLAIRFALTRVGRPIARAVFWITTKVQAWWSGFTTGKTNGEIAKGLAFRAGCIAAVCWGLSIFLIPQ